MRAVPWRRDAPSVRGESSAQAAACPSACWARTRAISPSQAVRYCSAGVTDAGSAFTTPAPRPSPGRFGKHDPVGGLNSFLEMRAVVMRLQRGRVGNRDHILPVKLAAHLQRWQHPVPAANPPPGVRMISMKRSIRAGSTSMVRGLRSWGESRMETSSDISATCNLQTTTARHPAAKVL